MAPSARPENGSAAPPPISPISLHHGGGAICGIGEKFGSDPVLGTGSPGRAGFGPSLVLSYDSGAGNGPFGYGWRLPLAAITRKTDKGLPRYRDAEESDVFLLSASEDLVPMVDEDGTPILDTGSVPGFTITLSSGFGPSCEQSVLHGTGVVLATWPRVAHHLQR